MRGCSPRPRRHALTSASWSANPTTIQALQHARIVSPAGRRVSTVGDKATSPKVQGSGQARPRRKRSPSLRRRGRDATLPLVSWSEPDVETILALMRDGATVMSGGSRCHTTYGYSDGRWFEEAFDEGYTSESPSSEAQVRALIAREPELFAAILAAPHRQRFTAAFLAGDVPTARQALRAAMVYGDELREGAILDAMLAWPEAAPSEEIAAIVRDKLRDFTAYHVLMGAMGWDRSPARAAQGIEHVDRLIAMVGDVPGCLRVRAAFHEQSGDLAAAERDLQTELDRTPQGDWRQRSYEEQLGDLRRRRGV